MDDEHGRSIVSFPYSAGAAEGIDASIVIKKRDALLGLSVGLGRGVWTNRRSAHSITLENFLPYMTLVLSFMSH